MWLLTRLVRRERPAIVHVASRLERPDEVLLGLGLHAQVGLPLVIALAPGHEPAIAPGSKGAGSPAGDRIDARVQSTIARCVAAADGLVVADAVGVTALRGLGVNVDRVILLSPEVAATPGDRADSDDLRSLGLRYRDVYDRLSGAARVAAV